VDLDPPVPVSTTKISLDDGGDIHVRRHGNPDGVRLVLSHGNGFAINGYFPYWHICWADLMCCYSIVVITERIYLPALLIRTTHS
jgi:hypothetical protein